MEFNEIKALLAEDDAISARIVSKVLEGVGCGVTIATDGALAWRLVGELQPRLVISDWMMPKLDGIELCRRIRGQVDAPYIYVIMLTARSTRLDRLEALQVGADDYLVKPLDRAEMIARLHVARRILTMQEELRDRQSQLERVQAVLERRNQELAELSHTDALTSLKNRRCFLEALEKSKARALRLQQHISLLMLDVDHFKQFNDRFGHSAGDDVLRHLSSLLTSTCRHYEMVARYGGEEFVVLLPATNAAASLVLAERLRTDIEGANWPHQPVTASLGLATSIPGGGSSWDLVEHADQALYESKRLGRNRVTHYDEMARRTAPVDLSQRGG